MGLKIAAICPLIAPFYNPASLHAREYKEAQDLSGSVHEACGGLG